MPAMQDQQDPPGVVGRRHRAAAERVGRREGDRRGLRLATNAVLRDEVVDEDASVSGLGLDGEADTIAVKFSDEVARGWRP